MVIKDYYSISEVSEILHKSTETFRRWDSSGKTNKRMKRIFILLILSLSIQYSFGQACGIYRIKYVGKIKSELLKIEIILAVAKV